MMKKTIFYVVFAGLLLSAASCGNQKQSKEDKDKAYRDSIEAEQAAIEEERKVAEPLSANAWGDVKFGMTVEEVSQTKVFGELKGNEDFYEIDGKKIGATIGTKALRKVTLGFNNDAKRLERIIFDSYQDLSEDRIPEAEADLHLIIGKFEEGFKTKFSWLKENVTKADLNEFNNVQLLSADYGFAGLVANIAKQYEGSKFYYDVVVNYNGPLE